MRNVSIILDRAADSKLANPRISCQVRHSKTGSLDVAYWVSAAGVPCVPGYHGNNQDPNFLLQEAEKIGLFLAFALHTDHS